MAARINDLAVGRPTPVSNPDARTGTHDRLQVTSLLADQLARRERWQRHGPLRLQLPA